MHTSCFNPQDNDRADDELVGDEEGWTFVTYKRFQKQRNPKPNVPYKKKELQANDSKVAPKGKGTNGLKEQRKGPRPNEGPLSVTLHEFFPKGFLIEGLMTTTYMVSCHDVDDQEDLTEKEEKVNLEETRGTKEEEGETHAPEETVAICAHCHDKMTSNTLLHRQIQPCRCSFFYYSFSTPPPYPQKTSLTGQPVDDPHHDDARQDLPAWLSRRSILRPPTRLLSGKHCLPLHRLSPRAQKKFVCKVFGLWGDLEGGFFSLLCKRQNGSLLEKFGDLGDRFCGEDEEGLSKDGISGFG
nr:hypothetical protein CFP56_08592 [Quercus suber]